MRPLSLVLALLALMLAACGKAPVESSFYWYRDLDIATRESVAQNKPVVVFFGASWDKAWKDIEYVTLRDPEVRARLRRDFVTVYIDTTDDESPLTRHLGERFQVIGDPTIVIMDPGLRTEIARFNEFIPPPVLIAELRDAPRDGAAARAKERAALRLARAVAANQASQRAWEAQQKTAGLPR